LYRITFFGIGFILRIHILILINFILFSLMSFLSIRQTHQITIIIINIIRSKIFSIKIFNPTNFWNSILPYFKSF
jgi:hypothetical protein